MSATTSGQIAGTGQSSFQHPDEVSAEDTLIGLSKGQTANFEFPLITKYVMQSLQPWITSQIADGVAAALAAVIPVPSRNSITSDSISIRSDNVTITSDAI